jgi:hypothetical protein
MRGQSIAACTGMRVLNVDIDDAFELLFRLHARQFASDDERFYNTRGGTGAVNRADFTSRPLASQGRVIGKRCGLVNHGCNLPVWRGATQYAQGRRVEVNHAFDACQSFDINRGHSDTAASP